MATTLASLRLELNDRLGLDINDPLVGEQDYDRALNSALQAISAERDWPWLIGSASYAVTAGVATVTVVDGVLKTISARIDNDAPLTFMTQDGVDLLFTPVDAGTPTVYTLTGNTITLAPIPTVAGSLKVTYYSTEPTLAADADAALIPPKFQAAVVEKAASILLRRVRDHDRAREAEDAYERWLVKMQDDQRRSSNSGQVKVRPGGWF